MSDDFARLDRGEQALEHFGDRRSEEELSSGNVMDVLCSNWVPGPSEPNH